MGTAMANTFVNSQLGDPHSVKSGLLFTVRAGHRFRLRQTGRGRNQSCLRLAEGPKHVLQMYHERNECITKEAEAAKEGGLGRLAHSQLRRKSRDRARITGAL